MSFIDLTETYLSLRKQFRPSKNINKINETVNYDRIISEGKNVDTNEENYSSKTVNTTRKEPFWTLYSEQTENLINKINNNLDKLSNLHTEGLKPSLYREDSKIEYKISDLTNKITREIRKAQNIVKKIANISEETENISTENKIIRLNLMRQKGNRIQTLNEKFRKLEKKYLEKLENLQSKETNGKGDISRLFEDSNPTNDVKKSNKTINHLFDEENLNTDSNFGNNNYKSSSQNSERESNKMEVMDDTIKKESIEATLANVEQLSDMFNDMKIIVVEQGTVLDRIDYQLEMAVENTDSGYHELVRTEENLKNDRTKKIVKWLLLIIIILFIANILKILKKSK